MSLRVLLITVLLVFSGTGLYFKWDPWIFESAYRGTLNSFGFPFSFDERQIALRINAMSNCDYPEENKLECPSVRLYQINGDAAPKTLLIANSCFSRVSIQFIAIQEDGSLKIGENKVFQRLLRKMDGQTLIPKFGDMGSLMAFIDMKKGEVVVVNIDTGRKLFTFAVKGAIHAVEFYNNDSNLAILDHSEGYYIETSRLTAFRLSDGCKLFEKESGQGDFGVIHDIAAGLLGCEILVAVADHSMMQLQTLSGYNGNYTRTIATDISNQLDFVDIDIARASGQIAAAQGDAVNGFVRIYDYDTGKQLAFLEKKGGLLRSVTQIAYSPSGKKLAVDSQMYVEIWRKQHPEYWWGVAWLWEFWVTVILGLILIWSIKRDRKFFRAIKSRGRNSSNS